MKSRYLWTHKVTATRFSRRTSVFRSEGDRDLNDPWEAAQWVQAVRAPVRPQFQPSPCWLREVEKTRENILLKDTAKLTEQLL